MTPGSFRTLLFSAAILSGVSCDDNSNPTGTGSVNNPFAMRFVGTGSAVEIQRPLILQPPHFTIEMWVYIDTLVSAYTPFLSANVNERNTADGYSIKYESNILYCRVATASNVAAAYWTNFSPPIRTWFHVATTFDGAYGKVYVDGVERASFASAGSVWYGSALLWLGCGYHADFGGYSFLHGMLDEVRIWNQARTETQIRGMKGSVLSGSEEGLVGYWNFDDTTNVGTVIDVTSHKNHGTMLGGLQRVSTTPF